MKNSSSSNNNNNHNAPTVVAVRPKSLVSHGSDGLKKTTPSGLFRPATALLISAWRSPIQGLTASGEDPGRLPETCSPELMATTTAATTTTTNRLPLLLGRRRRQHECGGESILRDEQWLATRRVQEQQRQLQQMVKDRRQQAMRMTILDHQENELLLTSSGVETVPMVVSVPELQQEEDDDYDDLISEVSLDASLLRPFNQTAPDTFPEDHVYCDGVSPGHYPVPHSSTRPITKVVATSRLQIRAPCETIEERAVMVMTPSGYPLSPERDPPPVLFHSSSLVSCRTFDPTDDWPSDEEQYDEDDDQDDKPSLLIPTAVTQSTKSSSSSLGSSTPRSGSTINTHRSCLRTGVFRPSNGRRSNCHIGEGSMLVRPDRPMGKRPPPRRASSSSIRAWSREGGRERGKGNAVAARDDMNDDDGRSRWVVDPRAYIDPEQPYIIM